MKILIIFGIVAFIAFSVWYAKRNGATAEYKSETKKILTEQDKPIDFGYKIVWIAVKTDNKSELLKILGFKTSKPSNWKNGLLKIPKTRWLPLRMAETQWLPIAIAVRSF